MLSSLLQVSLNICEFYQFLNIASCNILGSPLYSGLELVKFLKLLTCAIKACFIRYRILKQQHHKMNLFKMKAFSLCWYNFATLSCFIFYIISLRIFIIFILIRNLKYFQNPHHHSPHPTPQQKKTTPRTLNLFKLIWYEFL